jgi:phosphohistidine phosphatase
MLLYIARHAWAGNYGDPGWSDDSQRELTPEGIERYTQMIAHLAERGLAPQRIATSPYTRCRQTADIIARYTDHRPKVEPLDALRPGSELRALLMWTNEQPDSDACWVGHNPDVERLTAALISDRDATLRFAKGAIAAVRFDGRIDAGLGELCWFVTAKTVGV